MKTLARHSNNQAISSQLTSIQIQRRAGNLDDTGKADIFDSELEEGERSEKVRFR
jgi:hypothetical protein